MSDRITIRSHRSEYFVEFVDSGPATFREQVTEQDFVVIDQNICELYPELASLAMSRPHRIVVPSEQAKSYEALMPLIEQLITGRFTKSNQLVAIGGGIIQDITAFTASILYRGVDWTFFPTNLLTQCDSCIGSKTSINFGAYKNQLGGFCPPQAVFIDLNFLDTLPARDLRSGLGEMLHYFLVSGREDFDWAKDRLRPALTDRGLLRELLQRSLAIKKAVIEIDEFDTGPRNVFNFGHSFGHALESATHYEVPHGIAVSYGMDLANLISARNGYIPVALRNEVRPVLAEVWECTPVPELDHDRFVDALSRDKKNENSEVKVILTRGIGDMFKTTLELNAETVDFIKHYFRDRLWETAA